MKDEHCQTNKKNSMTQEITSTSDFVKSFTEAMTHDGIEAVLKLWSPDGEWVIMATGETFKGLDKIRELATRSVAARTHGSGEGLLPFNVFTDAEGTRLIWEYVHKAVVTDKWPASKDRPSPGTTIEIPIILSCDIRDGKLIKIREYFDLLTATEPGAHRKLYS
jgi:ketosteroid isomerase-like protein